MPKSEFLDLQDKNHDGLIDECEDLSIVPAAQCKGCVPNPVALTPNWMKKDETEPFLNEKICKFQITVQSDFSTTLEKSALAVTPEKPGPDAAQQEVLMRKRYKAYEDVAIAGLLDSYNKDPGTESQKKLKEVIEYTKFNLAPHGTSKVQFLYSVPHDTLMEIDEAPPDDDDVEDEGSDTVVKYGTSDIHIKLIRIRKALDLYNRYLKVFRAMEGGNIFFDETGAVFNLEDYGDFPGFGGLSVTGELMIGLDTWLGNKGYNIPGFQWSFFKDRVQDIEFTFNKDFKLKKLRIWTQDCAEKPITWTSSLKSLQRYSAWKDPTACAYLARLDAMETDLMARTPKPWLEFVKEHTFPKVHSTAAPETDPVEDVGSCIADALGKEFKQLGQDILDDVFSIGDAVAKSFHKRLCQESAKDMMEDFGRMGLVTGPIAEKFAKDRDKNTWALAMEQSYGVLEQDDPLVGNFCSVLCGTPGRNNLMGDPWAQLDNLWKHNLDKLKFCGLLDLMMNAIECLFKGLSLEEALASMLKAALKSMNLEDFGQLFVGLPPEKQAELDALVKQKLAENQIFKDGSANALAMDNVAGNYASIPKPWLDGTLVEQSKKDQREAGLEATAPAELQDPNEGGYKPLGEQFRIGAAAAQGLDSGVIMEAYALGLIEVFNDNLLALLDELNKFPGAPIVAFILAQMDCPRPPIFNPSILDFIKDIELPICNNLNDITFPKFINPFSWLPSLWDILGYLWWALKRAALNLLISIVMRIICKICEIIGDAVCKALELAGSVVAGIPDMISGRNSFTNIVRESICGPNADDDVVDDTVAEMFEKLGGAGANLADREAVKNFTEDLSSSITQQELFEAMLGNASESFKKMGGTLLNAEGNAGIAAAFKNGEGLATFCGNVGKLMSAEDRQQMRDALDASPDDLNYPVNPSLCASPEQLEEYEKVRCEVLEGRATPEQCQQMFENLKEQTLDDLDQLSQVAQGGIPNQFEREAPPLYSDPGCDNGFLPFEPEEVISTVGAVLDGNMEQLKIDFSQDMLGNGGIFDLQEDWGLMNMILSDTLGNPLSTHKRRVFNSPAFGSRNYVDFYMDIDVDKDDDEAFGKIAPIYDQRGAYPEKVAGWLQDELGGLTVEYKSNNDWEKDQPFSKHYDTLELDTDDNLAILKMPDFGFNIGFSTDIENEKIKFTKRGRKKTPDVTLRFEDNSNGQRLGDDSTGTEWTYGFDISLFMSDLIENSGDDSPHNIGSVTTPWDATRVVVTDLHNLNGGSSLTAAAKSVMTDEEIDEFNDNSDDSGESILDEQRFEFVAVDDSLGPDKVNLDQYPELLSCFVTQTAQTPALVLLGELTGVSPGALKSQYDEIMGTLIQQIATEVKDNEDAFSYGAVFDGLTASETEYVVSAGQTESPAGTLYNEAEVKDDDSGDLRKIKNMDTILGISRMQFNRGEEESRVLYLDPNTFGGSYMNPPLYIKPVPNKGWLGFVEVMFPNIGPCKPQRSDLIDFGDIQSKMGQDYPTLPEDKRLKGEPECIRELPYNRVLMRASTAGITALLSAACRIYASVHFIKAFATFTRFAPKFPDNYSNIFSQYIVENMERGFKDAQGSWAEFWNTFKDDEFWYGFLEQAVQQYERRLEKGEFQEMYGGDPPPYVQTALLKLGAKQESFHNIGEQALHDARDTSAASIFTSLTEYRTEQNLKFVRKTEESAKIILGEFGPGAIAIYGR